MSSGLRRWWFVGTSGSGKTTYANRVAQVLDLEHIELDSIYHQPGWTPMATDAFRATVVDRLAADGWTVCGNYRAVRRELLERADVLFVFDLPRATVMRQVTARAVRRSIRHEELWNGNYERLSNLRHWDPERNIVRWAWTTHHQVAERNRWLAHVARNRGIEAVRVTSHEEARAALASLTGADASAFLH